jgi:hypothetical protein
MGNTASYRALLEAGVSEQSASAAAESTAEHTATATKADIAELKADLTNRLVVYLPIFAAIIISVLKLT